MLLYQNGPEVYEETSKSCIKKFENKYSLKANIDKYVKIYKETYELIKEEGLNDRS